MQSSDKTNIAIDVQIPGFETLELIGEGGHGVVFKAKSYTLNRIVAIKLMQDDGSPSCKKNAERILNEGKLLARLKHPHIVEVYQVGVCDDGRAFLVTEFVEGKSLAEILQNDSLNQAMTALVIKQVADALSFLHANSLVHRDVKPSNIMVQIQQDSQFVHAKLLDFGVARDFDETSASMLETSTVANAASPLYMSPEQCKGLKATAQSDIYSLACVAYELVYKEPPYQADSALALQYKHINDDPAGIENLKKTSPITLCLRKGLSKDPTQRQSSANDFAKEFSEAFSHSRAFQDEPNGGPRKKFGLIGVVGVIVVVCLAVLLGTRKQPGVSSTIVPVHKASKRMLSRSAAVELSGLYDDYGKLSHYDETTTKFEQENNAFFQRADALIASKPEPQVVFSCYLLKYLQLRNLNCSDNDVKPVIIEGLKSTRDKSGKEFLQSAVWYFALAQIAFNEKDFPEATQNLSKAANLIKPLEDGAECYSLNPPSGIQSNVISQVRIGVPELFGRIEAQNRNYELAAKYFKDAESKCDQEFFLNGKAKIIAYEADMKLAQSKKREAVDGIRSYIKELASYDSLKAGDDNRTLAALATIAEWLYRHGEIAETKHALSVALDKCQKHSLIEKRSKGRVERASRALEETGHVPQWD